MKHSSKKPNTFTKLGILTVLIAIPVFSYLIFSTSAGQIINKTLKRDSLNNGLVGHWTFDGSKLTSTTATDSSGNGNNGTLTNGPTPTTGKIGQALEFDGVDDYVDVGDVASGLSAITVSAWIRTDTTTTQQAIIVKSDVSVNYEYGLQVESDGKIMFWVSTNGTSAETELSTDSISSGWHYVVGTYNGSIKYVYVDGVQSTGSNSSGDIYNGNTPLEIGVYNAVNIPFNGAIDDVRIYNRALSAEEINRLYHLGATAKVNKTLKSATSPLENGLVGHWTFDGKDMISNVADISGQGNHGSLQGQTSTTTAIGKIGQALEFDGVDDYVDIPALDTEFLGPLTISVWAKIDTGGAYRHFAGKHTSNGAANNPFDFKTSNDAVPVLRFTRANAGGYRGWSGPSVSIGEWKHYVVVLTSAEINTAPIFYVDGVATVGSNTDGTGSSDVTGSNANIRIGIRADDALKMDGKMDDVRIYNRALSAEEINRLYHLGATAKVNKTIKSISSSLDQGLVGHWTFDGKDMISNVADVSGQGNHGSLQGQTSTTTAIGKIGQALEFDGVDDYVDVGNDTSLVPAQITISMWVNPDTYPAGNTYDEPLRKEDSYHFSFRGDGVGTHTSTLEVGIKIGGTSYSVYIPNSDIPLGTWTHVILTADGSNVKAFVNGVQNGSDVSYSGSISNTAGNLVFIGTYGTTARSLSRDYDGLIDDVRIYNRALSADEVRRLYELGR